MVLTIRNWHPSTGNSFDFAGPRRYLAVTHWGTGSIGVLGLGGGGVAPGYKGRQGTPPIRRFHPPASSTRQAGVGVCRNTIWPRECPGTSSEPAPKPLHLSRREPLVRSVAAFDNGQTFADGAAQIGSHVGGFLRAS